MVKCASNGTCGGNPISLKINDLNLVCKNGIVKVNPLKRASTDHSVRGMNVLKKRNLEEYKVKMRTIIKNTYRTLMTRGMKGCYVYVCDEELRNYIKQWI